MTLWDLWASSLDPLQILCVTLKYHKRCCHIQIDNGQIRVWEAHLQITRDSKEVPECTDSPTCSQSRQSQLSHFPRFACPGQCPRPTHQTTPRWNLNCNRNCHSEEIVSSTGCFLGWRAHIPTHPPHSPNVICSNIMFAKFFSNVHDLSPM